MLLGSGTTIHSVQDAVLSSQFGSLAFERTFASATETWAWSGVLEGVPKPFGSTPGYEGSANWIHNWLSVARVSAWGGWQVLTPEGTTLNFADCGVDCYSEARGQFGNRDVLLYREASRFTVLRPDGRFVYETPVPEVPGAYYLTRIEDSQYPASGESARSRAELAYAEPSACPDAGIRLTAVQTVEGSRLGLSWDVVSGRCLVTELRVENGATQETVVRYAYQGSPPVLSSAARGLDGGGGTESYAFAPDAGFSLYQDGVLAFSHVLSGTVTETTEGLTTVHSKGTTTPGVCTYSPCNFAQTQNWTANQPTGQGLNDNRYAYTRTVDIEGPSSQPAPVVKRVRQQCIGNECSGYWEQLFGYQDDAGIPLQRSATAANGGVAAWNWQIGTATPPSGVSAPIELASISRGATDESGANALSTTSFTYSYGAVGQTPRDFRPLVSEESEASVLSAGQQARTVTARDAATNRITAQFRSGWTRVYDAPSSSWQTTPRTVGTFYFSHRKCTDSAADPLGRTVEIHGPCIVADTNATDCAAGAVFPVIQYEFYPAGGLTSRRLHLVREWTSATSPTACSGTNLVTSYDAYDLRGNATQITSPNGTSTYTWEDGQLATQTTAGHTTHFSWDTGHLAAVTYPEGNSEVFCYRDVALGSPCTSPAPMTRHLQWRARAANADGTSWTEAEKYVWLADGRLRRIETWDGATGQKRTEHTVDTNWKGELTYERWGTSSAPVYLPRRIDPDGNVTGVAGVYNGASSCSTPPAPGGNWGNECAVLAYDRAQRLASMDVANSSQGQGRTCLGYDAQGNVNSVQYGCPWTASSVGSCGACTAPTATYQHDDFGNVVTATLPATGVTSPLPIQAEYDARGNVVVRQTPEMVTAKDRFVSTYDGLGRLLALTHTWDLPSSGSETLHSSTYDSDGSLDSSCPQPANTAGRRRSRTDTFGQTWYQYDPEGRVLGEIRLRHGITDCNNRRQTDTPHTFYEYTDNGALSRIVYPYGRSVRYGYGVFGGKTTDRIASVTVSRWDGTSWSDWLALSSIAWEPFGRVRAWQFNGTEAAQPTSVEYFPANNATYPTGSTCPLAKPTSFDFSGRRQMLNVSRGALTLGAGAGDLYQQAYRYAGQTVNKELTCVTGSTSVSQVDFTMYYGAQFNTQSGGMTPVSTTTYDLRSNRKTMFANSPYADVYDYADAGVADRLVAWHHPNGTTYTGATFTFTYDADGRTTSVSSPVDSTGTPGWKDEWTPAANGSGGSGGLDTVYKAVSVNGAVYSYYYDAENRRRLKEYPTGTQDEYFYDLGHQLLVDQGNEAVQSPAYNVTDEYVWLDDVPALLMRGRIDLTADVRASDTSPTCSRNGEAAACGDYLLLTGTLGRPVAVVDSAGKLASWQQWNAFGTTNRRELRRSETAHPYPQNTTVTLANLGNLPPAGSNGLAYRVLFDVVDTEGTSVSPVDYAELKQGTTVVTRVGGAHLGRAWSPWSTSTNAAVSVTFKSDKRSCAPGGPCPVDGGVPAEGNYPYWGVAVTAYEVKQWEPGAKQMTTPLRFPGQYFDAETGAHENWNRFYEPKLGRYLSPEPMLQSPGYVRTMAARGMQVPTYAYAANNPLRYIDLDGLRPIRTAADLAMRYQDLKLAYLDWFLNSLRPTTPWGQLLYFENWLRELAGRPQRTLPGARGDGACGGAAASLADHLRARVDMEDVKLGEITGPWSLGSSHTTVQIDMASADGTASMHLGLDPFNAGVLPHGFEAGASSAEFFGASATSSWDWVFP